MAHSTAKQLWRAAQSGLDEVLQGEAATQETEDAAELLRMRDALFLKYVRIVQALQEAQDQLVQPQKRRLVERLLPALMGRVLELRRMQVENGMSEFRFMDHVMQDLKLTPSNVEIPIPKYFTREAERVHEERKVYLGKLLQEDELLKAEEPLPTAEEAVRIVQVAERGRQGRLRASIMRNIWREEQRERRRKQLPPVTMEPDTAATLIQKMWRGHHQRKETLQERAEEFKFIEMVPAVDMDKPAAAVLLAEEAQERMHALQEQRWAEYLQDQPRIRQLVIQTEGPDLKENLKEEIHKWFIECYNATGKFPDYPSVEQGGSDILFIKKTPEQLVQEIAAEAEEKERLAAKKAAKKLAATQEKKDKKEKKKKKKKKGGEPKPDGYSEFMADLTEGQQTYQMVWKQKDDSTNLMQRHEVELEKEETRLEVEKEIRLQVDELMREELKNLRMAIERDFSDPTKHKTRAKKKGKEKATKKKDKDLTANRTLSSLCDELMEQGLLKAAPHVRLASFLGDFSYLGSTLREADLDPQPSLYDIRQIIAMYAVLPLGSQALHQRAPAVRSMLLAGPLGVGKKTLLHSICTETSATLFDLSAANIAGKYPGKAGLQLMLHMVLKVAKLLQPSVLWIDNAEKTFLRRVSKEDRPLEPRRLRRELPRVLRQVGPDDRVLLLGTSRRPFDADPRPLFKVYERIVPVPRADYASRLLIWRKLIEQHGGLVSDALDLSSLAKISDGYTPGHLAQAVRAVLTEQRLLQQAERPLAAHNFIHALSTIEPVYEQEDAAFKTWIAKTPLMRKALKARREREAAEKAAEEAAEKERKRRR